MSRRRGHRDRLALILPAAVFLLANHLLLRGRAVGIWDADDQFFPFFTLVADHARALRLVSWDPWSNGGLPIGGEPQVGAFSPVTVGLGLLTGGGSRGFIAYWLLTWWAGGAGMFVLSRHLRAPRWASIVLALGFLFCGVYTANAEHISWVVGFSFLPWIVWRIDVACQTGRRVPAAQAGALWGLSALGGYPGLVIITAMFTGVWLLGRSMLTPGAGGGATPGRVSAGPCLGRLRRSLGHLVVMGGIGLVVLAPAYFSFFYEGAGTHGRVAALDRTTALANQLDPAALVTLTSAYPARLKARHRSTLFPSSDVSMANVYVGVVAPVLACFALLRSRGRAWRWWLLAVAGLGLAASMGESLPVRGWLYDWVYPTRFFRHSAIFRLYFVFTVCVLAALGARDLAAALRGRATSWRPFAAVSGGAATVAVAAYAIWLLSVATDVVPSPWPLVLGAPWLAVIGAIVVTGLAPHRSRARVLSTLLVALAAGDALLTSVLARPTMLQTGAAVTRWDRLDELHSRSLDLAATSGLLRLDSYCTSAPGERCKRNDQLITKVPVFRAGATQKNAFHEAMVADPVLHAMATGAARTWFSGTAARVSPSPAAFDRFRARATKAGRPPLLVHRPEAMLGDDGTDGVMDPAQAPIERLAPVEPIRVELHEYAPERLRFSVTAPARGWVLVTDRWARSWEAVVNGEPTQLYAGNFIFRAVPVREGRNMVDLTYRPRLMPWLVVLSWATLGVVLMLDVRRRERWRPQAGRHAVCAGAAVVVLMGWPGGAQAQTTPSGWQADWSVAEGFALTVDTEGYQQPTAIAFVPDPGPGPDDPLYFVTELHGRVRVVTRSRRVLDFAEGFVRRRPERELPDPQGETGLAGICLDPRHGYVFVTFAYRDDGGTLRNDIVRFAARPRTFAVRPTAQQSFTALFAPYRAAISHQIGGCQVQGDALFVTVGDGRQTEESRKPGSLLGKVLRMSLDGRPLPGGPFRSRRTADAAEYVWAMGFRNPFGLKSVGDRLFVADNGSRIDRFVEVRAGEDFLWNGSDMSLGARAAAVLYPAAGPAQMDFIPPGAPGLPPSLHGWFVIAASAPERTGVLALPYGFDQGRVRGAPQYIVRYEAGPMQIVAGVAVGPDGLYYAPILPDARGRTAVYRIQYDPPRAHPYRVDERRNVRAVIDEAGCLGCHRLGGAGGTAGPPLDRAELTRSLQARLDSPEYRRQVAVVDGLEAEPFASYRAARRAVLAASGSARLRTWLAYKLREPRFDNPDAQMPDPKLTEGEALRMADYLLNPGDRPAAPSRSLLARLLPSRAGRRHLAAAFGVGLIGGALGALAAVYVRRRHAGEGRPVARGDARQPTAGE